MSSSSHSASDFVMLGECLQALRNPQVCRPNLYTGEVGKFFTLLERTSLASTRRLAESLAGLYVPADQTGLISHVAGLELNSRVHPIATRLYEEANEKMYIETDAQIPASVIALSQQLERTLQPHQEALRSDTETCLRARLYRPAIVSAWNLCFDLVRWWLYSNAQSMSDFNARLQQRTANHRKGPRMISRYEDFFAESEAFVLEVCRDAGGVLSNFTEKTYRTLQHLLDDRNSFAHANFHDATEAEAKSYVDKERRTFESQKLHVAFHVFRRQTITDQQ
jgi:hypothetical protein